MILARRFFFILIWSAIFPGFLYGFNAQEKLIIQRYTESQNYEDLNQFLWEQSERNPMALFLLGMTTFRGQGALQDKNAAAELFVESWSGGFTEAGAAYCLLFVRQDLSPVDYSDCLEFVAESGNLTAKEALAHLIIEHDTVLPQLKSKYDYKSLLNEAYAAGSGFASLMLFLDARKFKEGHDYTVKEFNYLRRAANSFWLQSLYIESSEIKADVHLQLAFAYLKGRGTGADITKYFDHLKASFDLGGSEAACYLAQAYMMGAGVGQNMSQAAKVLKVGKSRGCKNHQTIEQQLVLHGLRLNEYTDYEVYSPAPVIWDFTLPLDSEIVRSKPNVKGTLEAFTKKIYPNIGKNSPIKIVRSAGGTCQGRGNFTTCSDGTTYQKVGNFAYGSDGSTFSTVGNTTFASSGITYHQIGRNTIGSDGTFCQTYGNTTHCR